MQTAQLNMNIYFQKKKKKTEINALWKELILPAPETYFQNTKKTPKKRVISQ